MRPSDIPNSVLTPTGHPVWRHPKWKVLPLLALTIVAASAGVALAAAPEAPEGSSPSEVKATSGLLHGVLDPGKEGSGFELGSYDFVYRKSGVACTGTGEVKTPEGLSLGNGKEEVAQEVTGLETNTQYTVCVVATNEAHESTVSAPVTFTTALPPETPAGEEAEVLSPTA